MESQLKIDLSHGSSGIELYSTTFIRSVRYDSYRGKYKKEKWSGQFQWTRAVRALTLLTCGSALNGEGIFTLKGGADSFASSLDYAISKSPQWLIDMFGNSHNSIPVAKLLMRRENPERKRGGLVYIYFNKMILSPANITVSFNGYEVKNEALKEITASIIRNNTRDHNSNPVFEQGKSRNEWSIFDLVP